MSKSYEMATYLYDMLDDLARRFGKVPEYLPLPPDEWIALVEEQYDAGVYAEGDKIPEKLLLQHSLGPVFCIQRNQPPVVRQPVFLPPAPLPEPKFIEPEQPHPLYLPVDYPRKLRPWADIAPKDQEAVDAFRRYLSHLTPYGGGSEL